MQIEHSNEVDLIRQTLAGNTSAFDRLVKTHRRTIYVSVLSYIKNPADAEDLTQQIFIRAYERLATLRELDRFLPWLQQIAHNACKDWLRRQSDSTTRFEEMDHADFTETAPSPEEIALKREIEAIVQEAIGTLTETDRKLVEGRYIEGASYDQLQVESGLSYAAIANRLKRARQHLRRRIERLLGGMAILPGPTLISGGIEAVKLSVKTKLVAIGVAAVLGTGGGVLYHHTFESNPISESQSAVVNEQRVSEPDAVTGDSSTVNSPKPPSQADIEAAIAALKDLDTTERRNKETEKETETESQTVLAETERNEKQELPPTLPDIDLKSFSEIDSLVFLKLPREGKRQVLQNAIQKNIVEGNEILETLADYKAVIDEMISGPLTKEQLSEVIQLRKEALDLKNEFLNPISSFFEDEEIIPLMKDLLGGIPVQVTEFLNRADAMTF